jgi:hypothetical protein
MQRGMNPAIVSCSLAVVTGAAVWALGGSVAFAKPASANANASSSSAAASDGAEPANWAEKKAGKLASEAIGADYWAGHYAMAEKKLREAIQICMIQHCSGSFQARLHRDLGVVYIAGMKHVEEGKDEFTAALTADSTLTLSAASVDMPSVKQAFDEVKASMSGSAKSTSASTEASAAADSSPNPVTDPDEVPKKEDEKAPAAKKPESAAGVDEPMQESSAKRLLNWFSLGIQQDVVFHSQTNDACAAGSPYKCYDANNNGQQFNPGTYVEGGNQVASGGFQLGTLRVLLGYDRVIGQRSTVGARLGATILGQSPIVPSERRFMYFHGEARGAVWLGHEPFGTSILHPYVFVSGGIAETDSKVLVQVQPNDNPNIYSFYAWKRSGIGFIGAGAGLLVKVTKRGGPLAELKYLQYLGPSVPSIAMQLGYTFGI